MNKINLFPLDVFFRAERYYIQGSLIISECYYVSEDYLKEALGGDDIVLKEVGFRSFLDTQASVVSAASATQAQQDNAVGYADFTRKDRPKSRERLLLLAHKDKPAPRHDGSPKVITNFQAEDAMVYTCDFTPTPENLVDGFFRSVIEITKKSHTLAFPGCSDILFIGLRRWAFPVSDPALLNQPGKHHIQIGSSMTKDGRGMTVSRLITTLASGDIFKGAITFSFARAPEN